MESNKLKMLANIKNSPSERLPETNVDTRPIDQLENLAESYADNGDFVSASKTYVKIVQLNPLSSQNWTSLGHCYFIIENYKKSFFAYQSALKTLKD